MRRPRRGSRPPGSRRAVVGRRILATIALVVVLPFVADTSAAPAGSRAARASIAAGSSFQRASRGSWCRRPRPASRDRRAAARAASISTASRALMPRRAYRGRQIPRTGDLQRSLARKGDEPARKRAYGHSESHEQQGGKEPSAT